MQLASHREGSAFTYKESRLNMDYDEPANCDFVLVDDIYENHQINDGGPYYANMPQLSIAYVAPTLETTVKSEEAFLKYS